MRSNSDKNRHISADEEADTGQVSELSSSKASAALEPKKHQIDDQEIVTPKSQDNKSQDSQDTKGSIAKETKIFINTNTQSDIHSIELYGRGWRDSLVVHFKNESSAFIKANRIVHFFNKAEEELDSNLKDIIKTAYKDIFEKFDGAHLSRLTQTDINEIYSNVYDIILIAKNEAIESGKPLHIVIGENHYSQNSLLYELIILDVTEHLGLKTVCLEVSPDIREELDKGHMSNLYYSSENTPYIYLNLKTGNINVIPIDSEVFRDRTLTTLKAQSLVEKNELDDKTFGELADYYGEKRDTNMVINIAKTTLINHDENEKPIFKKTDLRVTIVGSGHLRGIVQNKISSDLYYLLPINTAGDNLGDKILYDKSSYHKRSLFFAITPPRVTQLKTEKDCSCYTNFELHKMVMYSKIIFQNNQSNLFKNECKAVITILSDVLQELKSSDEEVLSTNLDKVMKSINNDKVTLPSVKRMELRAAIADTMSIMKNKQLFSDSSVLSNKLMKINSMLEVTPALNAAEYTNLRRKMAGK